MPPRLPPVRPRDRVAHPLGAAHAARRDEERNAAPHRQVRPEQARRRCLVRRRRRHLLGGARARRHLLGEPGDAARAAAPRVLVHDAGAHDPARRVGGDHGVHQAHRERREGADGMLRRHHLRDRARAAAGRLRHLERVGPDVQRNRVGSRRRRELCGGDGRRGQRLRLRLGDLRRAADGSELGDGDVRVRAARRLPAEGHRQPEVVRLRRDRFRRDRLLGHHRQGQLHRLRLRPLRTAQVGGAAAARRHRLVRPRRPQRRDQAGGVRDGEPREEADAFVPREVGLLQAVLRVHHQLGAAVDVRVRRRLQAVVPGRQRRPAGALPHGRLLFTPQSLLFTPHLPIHRRSSTWSPT